MNNEINNQKYFLGLDIGTNSIGWCVTDENYNIVKVKKQSLIGVRLFDESESAKERRSHRISRRLLRRRNFRIHFLREQFAEEINKVDPLFYERMDLSFYNINDKLAHKSTKYSLFNDENYTDKDYYKNYPTIYHLRKALMEENKKFDIRLIYLAISNIYKHRGNFLKKNFDVTNIINENEIDFEFEEINLKLDQLGIPRLNYLPRTNNFNELKEAFDKYYGKELIDKLIAILQPTTEATENGSSSLDQKSIKAIYNKFLIRLFAGTNADLFNIWNFIENNQDEASYQKGDYIFQCDNENFEELCEQCASRFPEKEYFFDIVLKIKEIHDSFILAKQLQDKNCISNLMISRYEEHKKDLKALKRYIRTKFGRDEYNRFFRMYSIQDKKGNITKESGIYASYTYQNKIKKKITPKERYGLDKVYSAITKLITDNKINVEEECNTNSDFKRIYTRIKTGEFLLKPHNSGNGSFPYQLHEYELKRILNNQEKYYPFLSKMDEHYHISIKDKIISLFTFQIPYYVGPLANNANKSSYAWAKRISNDHVLPWNFNDVIDVESTAKEFVQRMMNYCSYIKNEYCLPKDSIIFSYYNCLSYLNKISINKKPIDQKDKENIINNLFMKFNNVKAKDIMNYFKQIYNDPTVNVTTSNGKPLEEVTCQMKSYIDFVNIFGEEFVKDNIEFIEHIINDIAILHDSDILEKQLSDESKYGLPKDKVKQLLRLKYKGFSSLSKYLLCDLKIHDDDNLSHETSILKLMSTSNYNLMEVLHCTDAYKLILEHNQSVLSGQDITLNQEERLRNYIDKLYIPTMSKRAVLQSYKIIEEVEKILNHKIDKYFIEFTREEGKKERTIDRYERINKLISPLREEYKELYQQFKEYENDHTSFRSDYIYLYFMQLGKDLYTGENIDFDKLISNSSFYDIDHIVPRSIIKNDSISNKVLTRQEFNKEKSNALIIPRDKLWVNNGGYKKAYFFYKFLKEKKLIEDVKYVALTRTEFSKEELEGFVNRQIVVTNQATKGIVELLREFKGVVDNDIIFCKAENTSAFRNKYDFVKTRTANNFHHAHDAYLNIIVGNMLKGYFSRYKIEDFRSKLYSSMNTEDTAKRFTTNVDRIIEKPIIYNLANKVIWDKDKLLPIIRDNIYNRFDIMTTVRTFTKNEIIHHVTIEKKEQGAMAIKQSGPLSQNTFYGFYSSPSYKYFSIVKTKKNKNVLLPIPGNYKDAIDYISKNNFPYTILVPKVKINSVFIEGKKKFYVTGVTGKQILFTNLHERFFPEEMMKTINKIDHYNKRLDYFAQFENQNKANRVDLAKEKFNLNENNDLILYITRLKAMETISSQELIELFNYMISMLKKEVYSFNATQNLIEILSENQNRFNEYDINIKLQILTELLNYLACNKSGTIDLTYFNSSKNSCKLIMNQTLPDHIKLVEESITGFYRKIIWKS